ncbi:MULTISPECIES: glycoside hydrolase family 18 protein [unclassified Nocardioides]|uniref:glycoside hydrolase family 18 protein n=1 Tax=unclassified Nocardioides TaxID=2615069 RepID=UPI0030148BE7
MRSTFLPTLLAAAALGAGLLTTVPGVSPTATAAAAAPTVATTAPAAKAGTGLVTGEPTAVWGKARHRGTVVLQRQAGKRWVPVAQRRTDRGRRYVFRFVAPAATTTYRVVAARKVRKKRWVSEPRVVRVTPQRGTVTVPAATQARTRLPATVAFTPARPGRPVQLQARVGSDAWRTVATARQDVRGGAVFVVEPTATTSYRAVTTGWYGAVAATSVTRAITVRAPRTEPWVTGYYAGWFWNSWYDPEDVDLTAMTHLVFGRVAPGGGGLGGEPGDVELGAVSAQEGPLSWAPYDGRSVEDYLVDEAHAAGTEALLMLGGDGLDGRGFVLSTADAVRPRFVENVVDYLVAHDYDGVDVDWENCFGGSADECGEDITAAESHRRLFALILEIRAEMATRPRYATDPGLITFPGYAQASKWLEPGDRVEQWRADTALLVDQYNLMSYGIGTTWFGAGWDSWFSGALDGEDRAGHPYSIDSSVDAYVATGVPRERMGLGIGFYGIYYGPTVTGPRQDLGGNDVYEIQDAALAWSRLEEMGYLSHGELQWDEEASSTYRTYEEYGEAGFVPESDPNRNPAGFLSYEDERSIAAKGAYARETGLGGTIIWVLNYGARPNGDNPLLDQVRESFLQR